MLTAGPQVSRQPALGAIGASPICGTVRRCCAWALITRLGERKSSLTGVQPARHPIGPQTNTLPARIMHIQSASGATGLAVACLHWTRGSAASVAEKSGAQVNPAKWLSESRPPVDRPSSSYRRHLTRKVARI